MRLFRRRICKILEDTLGDIKTLEDLNRLKGKINYYENNGYPIKKFKDRYEDDIKILECLFKENEKIK